MRCIATAFILCLLLLPLGTAPSGGPSCSCSSSSPQVNSGGEAQPVPAPQSQVRREAPPLYAPGTPPPKVKPMTLKDEQSGTLFYFESDGQHVTAIDKDGAVLWHKNPVEEAGLKGFSKDGKNAWPTICYAGPPPVWTVKGMQVRGKREEYLAVTFSTKQFGLLEKQTGAFTLLGSD